MATVQEALQIAFDHHMAGRLAEAEVIYARILEVVPDHTEALHLSGMAAAQAGRLDDGGRQLRRAVATGPDRADIHKNLGNLCKAHGADGAAAACYGRAARLRPDDAETLAHLGVLLHTLGRCADSADALDRVVDLCPEDANAYRNLGIALDAAGLGDAAAARYRAELAAKPDDRTLLRKLATALEQTGDVRGTAQALLRARGFGGDLPGRYGDLAALMPQLASLGMIENITTQDAIVLHHLANRAARPGAVFIEIGSWLGMSTAILADVAAACGGRVFAVDTWEGSDDTWQVAQGRARDVYDRFRGNLVALGFLDTVVTPVRSRSDACAGQFADGAADLLFIDGDHRYHGVRSDIVLYAPKVRPGGIVCGHDCERLYSALGDAERARVDGAPDVDFIPGLGHPGVIRAAWEAYGERLEMAGLGSVMWWVGAGPSGV